MNPRSAHSLLLLMVLSVLLMAAGVQSEPSSAANLTHLLRQLADEARQSQTDGALRRSTADFARSLEEQQQPAPAAIADRIMRRGHQDAFIDAYVRWQLTSFETAIDTQAIGDREFERLVRTLPDSLSNPRADDSLIRSLQDAATIGVLAEAQQAKVEQRLNDLAAAFSTAREFNVPSDELHQWLIRQFQAQPHRALTLRLIRVVSLARNGWPVDEEKNALDREIERCARIREFTPEQRRDFLRLAERCLAPSRLYVTSAGVVEGTVSANYGTTGVFDFDVRRWAKALSHE